MVESEVKRNANLQRSGTWDSVTFWKSQRDKRKRELAAIGYIGFSDNLEQSLRYLVWAANYAENLFNLKMDEMLKEYGRLYVVVYEKDRNHSIGGANNGV